MRATAWEYRLRVVIVGALFALAFALRRGARVADGVAGLLDAPPEAGLRVTLAASTVLLAIAAWLRVWGAAYLVAEDALEPEGDDGARAADGAGDVAADGPFRHVRNPLHLGTLLYAVGLGAWGTIAGWCVLVVALVVFVLRLIGREEREHLASQREAYVAYCAAVPHRLWPSLRPRVPARRRRPRWGDAIEREVLAVGSVAASAFAAVTLHVGFALASIALLVVAWAALQVRRASVHAPVSPSDDR